MKSPITVGKGLWNNTWNQNGTKFFKEFEKWKQKEEKKRKRRGKNTREVKGKKTRFVRRKLTSFNLWESDFLSKFQDAITSVQDQSKNPKKCSQLSYKLRQQHVTVFLAGEKCTPLFLNFI